MLIIILTFLRLVTVGHISFYLKAQAAAIKAAFVHGCVLPNETLTQSTFVLEKQVAVTVVMQHSLSQIQQGTQLAQRTAIGLHFPSVMRCSEEDAAPVGCNVAPLVDNVEKAATHHLQIEEKKG